LLREDGGLEGVLALELDNAQVFRVFQDLSGLGRTGEALVGSLSDDGQTIELVMRPRLADTLADQGLLTVRVGSERGLPVQRAVRADRGAGESIDYRGKMVLAVWGYLPSFRWGLVVKQDVEEAFALISRQWWVMGILLALTALGVTLAALTLSRALSRPVETAAQLAQRVAAGDLTSEVAMEAEGEPGQMLEALRTMTRSLRRLIGRARGSAEALQMMAVRIAETAGEEERTVSAHSAATTEVSASARQIRATSQDLLETMRKVQAVLVETAREAETSREDLARTDGSLRGVAESSRAIDAQLGQIQGRAESIDVIINTITKVADQTNLLSINAAIEAERAGEAGRGFLVVAREIRRLADQTAGAMVEIDRIVEAMRTSIGKGLEKVAAYDTEVQAAVEDAGRVARRLGRILESVARLTPQFELVARGMSAQTDGAGEIGEAISHVSEGINRSASSLRAFQEVTARLREAAESLQADIAQFTLTEGGRYEALGDAERESRIVG
jgi:methyl-accepting chemotaxis protein WspA